MTAYCKTCRCEHAAWNRLNDGYICGLCGTRVRDLYVQPFNAPENKPTRTGRLKRRTS